MGASRSLWSHSDVTVDETAYSYRHTINFEPQLPPFCTSREAHFRCSPTLPNPHLHLRICPTQCNCCLVCCHARHIDETCCPSAVRHAVLELHPNASADWKCVSMRCLGHHWALSRKRRSTSENFSLLQCVRSWFLPAERKLSQLLRVEARGERAPVRTWLSFS